MTAYCVVTTINKPTIAISKLYEVFGENLIVVGDKKTPKDWCYEDVRYMPFVHTNSWGKTYRNVSGHYARKNHGYMEAFMRGATMIYDTDDDNIPNDVWRVRDSAVTAKSSKRNGDWYNAYQLFTDNPIWPRGFPLKLITNTYEYGDDVSVVSSIQQGLSDGEPDVDAIWRLVFNKRNVFDKGASIWLEPGNWCPFNSQTTWWFRKAFPLMYLPVNSTFRMTDIWRGFVAQRCLWALGEGVTFHSPSEVYQDRNEHDYLKDFEDEVPGYLKNEEIVGILSGLKLAPGEDSVCDNLVKCYQAIVDRGILPEMEMWSLNMWVDDYKKNKLLT